MNYSFNNNKLFFHDQQIIEFEYPIIDTLESIDGNAIVLLDKEEIEKENTIRNRNVYGVDSQGNILWQVEEKQHIYDNSPYINLSEKDEKIRLHNWDGTVYRLDTLTGKLDEEFWTR